MATSALPAISPTPSSRPSSSFFRTTLLVLTWRGRGVAGTHALAWTTCAGRISQKHVQAVPADQGAGPAPANCSLKHVVATPTAPRLTRGRKMASSGGCAASASSFMRRRMLSLYSCS